MRWGIALVWVLATAAIAAPSASAQPVARAGRALASPLEPAPERQPNAPLIGIGLTSLLVGYAGDLAASAALWATQGDNEFTRDRFFFGLVPLLGPWVQLANEPDEGWAIYWGIAGGLQLVGIGLVALGHVLTDDAPRPAVVLVPSVGVGEIALNAGGNFD